MADATLWLGDALAVGGTAFATLAVAGVLRFPRAHAQIHAAAATAIAIVVVLGACVLAGGPLAARAVLVAAFLLISAPVSAHALARLEALRLANEPEDER